MVKALADVMNVRFLSRQLAIVSALFGGVLVWRSLSDGWYWRDNAPKDRGGGLRYFRHGRYFDDFNLNLNFNLNIPLALHQ